MKRAAPSEDHDGTIDKRARVEIVQPSASLADMPASWIVQLRAALAPEDCKAAFRTCKALRDMLLLTQSVSIRFGLPLPDTRVAIAKSTLRHCRRLAGVRLILAAKLQDASLATDSASVLLATALGKELLTTQVNLTGMQLNSLVPAYLTAALPHLRELQLTSCELAPRTFNNACSGLTCLRLANNLALQPTQVAPWQKQLRSLRGLKRLHVTGAAEPAQLLANFSPALTHLTFLRFNDLPNEGVLKLPEHLGRLCELQLPRTLVDDAGIDALLSLTRLTRLECYSFQLTINKSDRECTWRHLTMDVFPLSEMINLPLAGIQVLEAADGVLDIIPNPDLEATATVVEAIARCGGIRASTGCVVINNGPAKADYTCIAKALDIVCAGPYRVLTLLNHQPLLSELVTYVGRMRAPNLALVHYKKCHFAPDVLPMVLSSVPPSVCRVRLAQKNKVLQEPDADGKVNAVWLTEVHLRTILAGAVRPVTLDIMSVKVCKWEAGWEARAMETMASAGHSHVTIQVRFEDRLEEEEADEEEEAEEEMAREERAREARGEMAVEVARPRLLIQKVSLRASRFRLKLWN